MELTCTDAVMLLSVADTFEPPNKVSPVTSNWEDPGVCVTTTLPLLLMTVGADGVPGPTMILLSASKKVMAQACGIGPTRVNEHDGNAGGVQPGDPGLLSSVKSAFAVGPMAMFATIPPSVMLTTLAPVVMF